MFGAPVVHERINTCPAFRKNVEVILRHTVSGERRLEIEDGTIDRLFRQLERSEVMATLCRDPRSLCAWTASAGFMCTGPMNEFGS